jgi:hypothetical protein
LDTGDYTIQGYEKLIAIERKGSITEWAANIVQPRFERELQRLSKIKYAYILLEFDMHDIMNYPASAGTSFRIQSKFKLSAHFILKKTLEFQVKYGVKILFCGPYGKDVALSLFKRVLEINK